MPIKKEMPDARLSDMREAFLQDAGDLWDNNQEKFMALLGASEDKKVNLTFHAKIDFSESEASMQVDIGFGQRYTDNRKRTFTDPNQPTLPMDGAESNGHRNGNGLSHLEEISETAREQKAETAEAVDQAEAVSPRGRKKKTA